MAGNHNFKVVGSYIFDNHEKNIDDDLAVVICDDTWIGCNAIILKGVTVGRGAIIGAGAVVTKTFHLMLLLVVILHKKLNEDDSNQVQVG